MVRRPPRSTLFPTRRSSDLRGRTRSTTGCGTSSRGAFLASCGGATRSEEHTSELQSRGHLVCRLLLEKKKGHAVCEHPRDACRGVVSAGRACCVHGGRLVVR